MFELPASLQNSQLIHDQNVYGLIFFDSLKKKKKKLQCRQSYALKLQQRSATTPGLKTTILCFADSVFSP